MAVGAWTVAPGRRECAPVSTSVRDEGAAYCLLVLLGPRGRSFKTETMPVSNVQSQLHLYALRSVAWAFLVVVLPGLAVALSASDSDADLTAPWALLVFVGLLCAFAVTFATTKTAQALGQILTGVVFVAPLVRAYDMDDKVVVVWMVVYGSSSRILPALAAVFNGRVSCVVVSVLSALSPLLVVTAQRYVDGQVALADLFNVYGSHISPDERVLLVREVYNVGTATAMTLALQAAFRQALALLTSELAVKQRFITDMVRTCAPRSYGVVACHPPHPRGSGLVAYQPPTHWAPWPYTRSSAPGHRITRFAPRSWGSWG